MASVFNNRKHDGLQTEVNEAVTSLYSDVSAAEDSDSPGGSFEVLPLDYWYGAKCFETTVAKDVFLSSSGESSIPNIDSRVQRLIREFPYMEVLCALQKEKSPFLPAGRLGAETDGYRKLVSLVGTTVRLGTLEERTSLFRMIERSAGFRNSNVHAEFSQPSGNFNDTKSSPLDNQARLPTKNKVPNIGHYTTKLKEKADLQEIKLEYDIDRAPNDISLFKAEVTYKGQTFAGFGRSRKDAKHEASKQACIALGLAQS